MILEKLDANRLYQISETHNLAALCWYYLKKSEIPIEDDLKEDFNKASAKEIYMRKQYDYAFEKIKEDFGQNGIYFLPLKGLVVKDYYDVPELRYSCDLDILIHGRDITKARHLLEEDGWSTDGRLNFHDVHFHKNKLCLELHFNICENMLDVDNVLAEVWDNVRVKEGYMLELREEFLLYHQIAHAYYHYMHGGCGLKSVIDVKVLRDKLSYDEKVLLSYLQRSKIVDFYQELLSLIEYWFKGKKATEKDRQIEAYIIEGGAYGNHHNSNNMVGKNSDGRLILLRKLFLPRKLMYAYYPAVARCHLLLPIYHIRRWSCAVASRVRRMGYRNLKK